MPVVEYTSADGSITLMEGSDGSSVMETATRNGVPGIVGECGGSLSCATCHVFVSAETLTLADPMTELEDDMLDGTAVERRENSRLSCQLKLHGDVMYRVTTPETQL
ncbi:MAG: 2Fe-2S iron-sulfur cluster-binding protein [Pseudolysinimonas sp.]